MKTIKVFTSDSVVWNESEVQKGVIDCMLNNDDICLDLLSEGPDLKSLSLYHFLKEYSCLFKYDLKKVCVATSNALESHNTLSVNYRAPIHLVNQAKDYTVIDVEKNCSKHFGIFIGRSNAPRLDLASYIDSHYKNKTICTYHFDPNDEFHLANIGLEDLLRKHAWSDLTLPARFLQTCPVLLDGISSIKINKEVELNPAQQLLSQDRQKFSQLYNNFFVEIVCESYYTGNTFFITEKTWRPMLLKTPFIVQGPRYFLQNLRKMGFRTFDQWWDEGYSEDPTAYQIGEIKKILDFLSTKSTSELNNMYNSMKEILNHNYNLLMSLTKTDFEKIRT